VVAVAVSDWVTGTVPVPVVVTVLVVVWVTVTTSVAVAVAVDVCVTVAVSVPVVVNVICAFSLPCSAGEGTPGSSAPSLEAHPSARASVATKNTAWHIFIGHLGSSCRMGNLSDPASGTAR
jgi:hypothetical protein